MQTKEITNKVYEIIGVNETECKLVRKNCMFKNRSRASVASFDKKIQGYNPFIVVIGGSDQFTALNMCELYYPCNDTFYSFPSLNINRENSSVCIMDNLKHNGEIYIYIFGGFNKKEINQIERIKLEFD